MNSIRIASTPVAGLTPIGDPAARDHGRVTARWASLAAEGGGCSLIFADPEPTRDGQRIDWYVPGGKNYIPLSSLGAEERTAALSLIEGELSRLRGEGERLRARGDPDSEALIAALSLPAPIEQYVHVCRDADSPDRLQAVLVCWGYGNDLPMVRGLAPEVMARQAPSRPIQGSPTATILATAPALTAPLAGSKSRRWWLMLWLALLVLLLMIAWLMLRACGVGLPQNGALYHLGAAFCPGTALAATDQEERRSRELTDLARELQLQVEQRKVECLAERAPSTPPVSTPLDPRGSSMAERLEREKAKTGELQVSLAWDGPADLDLHIECPNGETIYFSQRSGCGGALDVDMNSGPNKSLTPVENVFWPEGQVSSGRYKISVILYDRHGDQRPSIPFEVRIKNGGAQQTVPGSVSQPSVSVPVTEFVR